MAIIQFTIPTSNEAGYPVNGSPVVFDGGQIGRVVKVDLPEDGEETVVTAWVEDVVMDLMMLTEEEEPPFGIAMIRPLDGVQQDVDDS